MRKGILIAVAILGVCLVLAVHPKTYVVRGSINAGRLYWNTDEALLFIAEVNDGAEMSYARYALEPLFLRFGHVRSASNQRCSRILVIRITSHGIEPYDTDLHQYAQEPYCGFHFDLFRGHIYAVSWPKLWVWSGTGFAPAGPDELRTFAAAKIAKASSEHPWRFDDVDGWSMREFGQTPPTYRVVLGGQPMTVIFHAASWPPAPLSVELIRTGENPQTIWSLDERARRVSRVEYEHLFAKR